MTATKIAESKLSVPYPFTFAFADPLDNSPNLIRDFSAGGSTAITFLVPDGFRVLMSSIKVFVFGEMLELEIYTSSGPLTNGLFIHARDETGFIVSRFPANKGKITTLAQYVAAANRIDFIEDIGIGADLFRAVYEGEFPLNSGWALQLFLEDDFSDLTEHEIVLSGVYQFNEQEKERTDWPHNPDQGS